MEFRSTPLNTPAPSPSLNPPNDEIMGDSIPVTEQNQANNSNQDSKVNAPETVPISQPTSENDNRHKFQNNDLNAIKAPISYKDSLIGYNGCFGSQNSPDTCMGNPPDSQDADTEWIPSEETKKLMELYPMVPITDEEWRNLCKPWKEALIINTLGLRLNVKSLKPKLARIWNLRNFELIDLASNFYIVKTEDPSHYSRILNDGPCVMLDHCVLVQRWTPDFNPNTSHLGKVALWVRLSNIPIQCYNRNILWRIGNCIGKTLKVDPHTLTHNGDGEETTERGKFVRISVEVDLRKKLVPRILIRDEVFNVEYESLNLICFSCGTYGHNRSHCPHDPKN